jgi:hypothetical protein
MQGDRHEFSHIHLWHIMVFVPHYCLHMQAKDVILKPTCKLPQNKVITPICILFGKGFQILKPGIAVGVHLSINSE